MTAWGLSPDPWGLLDTLIKALSLLLLPPPAEAAMVFSALILRHWPVLPREAVGTPSQAVLEGLWAAWVGGRVPAHSRGLELDGVYCLC